MSPTRGGAVVEAQPLKPYAQSEMSTATPSEAKMRQLWERQAPVESVSFDDPRRPSATREDVPSIADPVDEGDTDAQAPDRAEGKPASPSGIPGTLADLRTMMTGMLGGTRSEVGPRPTLVSEGEATPARPSRGSPDLRC